MRNIRNKLNQQGFTLAEVLVVMILLPMMLTAVYGVWYVSNAMFKSNDIYGRLNQAALQTLRYVDQEIGQSNPLLGDVRLVIEADAGGNSVIRFQIPVDWDNDGDAVTDDQNPVTEWGAYAELGQTQDGLLGSWIRYRLVNGSLTRDILDQALASVEGSEEVIAAQVTSFQSVKNGDYVDLDLAFQSQNELGFYGDQETLTGDLHLQTLLRNATN